MANPLEALRTEEQVQNMPEMQGYVEGAQQVEQPPVRRPVEEASADFNESPELSIKSNITTTNNSGISHIELDLSKPFIKGSINASDARTWAVVQRGLQ